MKQKIIKLSSFLLTTSLLISILMLSVYANSITPYGIMTVEFVDNGYDAEDNIENCEKYSDISPIWWTYISNGETEITLEYCDANTVAWDQTIKIPDRFIGGKQGTRYVTSIVGSCDFKEFDLNPQNEYMTLIDNVIFSKDGEILMSYARNDERKVYNIPNNTKVIGEKALQFCENIKRLTIPNSVEEIRPLAFEFMKSLESVNIPSSVRKLDSVFVGCGSLKEVLLPKRSKLKAIKGAAFSGTQIGELTLPSFDVEIDKEAFVGCNGKNCITLKSYVKPDVSAEQVSSGSYRIKWDKISNVSYYEVYQKKNDGTYKLLKTVKGNSIKINKLKNGKNYIFAVKPYAEIKAYGDGGQYCYLDLPEYFTVEGTMSEDVTVDLK